MDLFYGAVLLIVGLVVLVFLCAKWADVSERRRVRKRGERNDRALEAEERSWIEAWHSRGEPPPLSATAYYQTDWEAEQDKARMLSLHYTVDADDWILHEEFGNRRRIAYRLTQRTIAALSKGQRLEPF